MFTGLVQEIKEVTSVSPLPGGALQISVARPAAWDTLRPGDSILVDGICLTASYVQPNSISFDVVAETVARSTASSFKPGRRVNLEQALTLSDRIGGHLLSGHVDGVGQVISVAPSGTGQEVTVSLDPSLAKYIALKGSVALNGVSLTVSGLEASAFKVSLIPETLRRTNLASLAPGDHVNVEVDLLARYLERLLSAQKPEGLSFDTLARHGFA